jgi:hypothetical protein
MTQTYPSRRRRTRGDYLGALAAPIERAAVSYQGLDLKVTLLIRFVDDGLDFFVGCAAGDF